MTFCGRDEKSASRCGFVTSPWVFASDSITLWHLRCRMREALLDFVQRGYPDYLPNVRARVDENEVPEASRPPAAPEI